LVGDGNETTIMIHSKNVSFFGKNYGDDDDGETLNLSKEINV
jgi:hypothetical protein